MKLTRLKASGLKGAKAFEHDLEGVNLIVGKNWSGKTAILEAVRLALMGKIPELGERPQAAFDLCSGAKMTVTAELDSDKDGKASLTRSWKLERGSVKYEGGAVEFTIPPVLLDPNEYFSLGDKDRMRYVFSQANLGAMAGGDEAEQMAAERKFADAIISNLKNIKCTPHKPEHEAVIAQLVTAVNDGDMQRHEEGTSVQDWLEGLTKEFRDALKTAKQNADRMTKTVQGLAQIKSAEDPEAIENTEEELKQLRAELAEVNRLSTELASKLSANSTLINRRNYTCDQLKGTANYAAQIAAAEADLAATPEPAYISKTQELDQVRQDAYKLYSRAELQVEALNEQISQAAAKLKEVANHSCCPYCKSNRKGWQAALDKEYTEQLAKITAELVPLEKQRQAFMADWEKAKTAVEASLKADEEHREAERCYLGKVRRVNELRGLDKSRADLQAKLDAMDKPLSDEDLKKSNSDRSLLDEKRGAIDIRINVAEQRLQKFRQEMNDRQRSAQALQEHAQHAAEVAVIKSAVDILEALQAETVKQAFDVILQRASLVTRGMLKTDLAYKDGEIGRFEGATFVSHKTFSGAEKALTYAGISLALAWGSPIKVVMLDEMNGRLDPENFVQFMDRMGELVATGAIDQFIGACTDYDLAEEVGSKINVILL